jgi:hypothetical protein
LIKLRDCSQAEGEPWLAEQLTRHVNDERRHSQIDEAGHATYLKTAMQRQHAYLATESL